MRSILFDSSVWIDALKGRSTPQADFLRHAIASEFLEVFVTATIVQEVLQGVRTEDEFSRLEAEFREFLCLQLDHFEAAVEAARLFRSLRKKGLTIRKPNDCLIAVHAMRHQMELCHADSDFDLIAAHSDLRLASLPR